MQTQGNEIPQRLEALTYQKSFFRLIRVLTTVALAMMRVFVMVPRSITHCAPTAGLACEIVAPPR